MITKCGYTVKKGIEYDGNREIETKLHYGLMMGYDRSIPLYDPSVPCFRLVSIMVLPMSFSAPLWLQAYGFSGKTLQELIDGVLIDTTVYGPYTPELYLFDTIQEQMDWFLTDARAERE